MVRETNLSMEVPMIIMDWAYLWFHYSGRWYDLFPTETYGQTMFDTHIYDFKDTV